MTNSQYIFQEIINKNKNERCILTNNSFQYNIENNILHLLLWVNPSHQDNTIIYKNNINLNNYDILDEIVNIKLNNKFNKNLIKKENFIYF